MKGNAAGQGPVERPVRPVAWLAPETGQVYRDGDITNPGDWAIPLYPCKPLYDQAALDAAVAAERERWEAPIGAVMPFDFKQWHDSPDERPATAAWSISNAREHADIAWIISAARVNELECAVRKLAALNAWHHFGECRAWGVGPIISPHEADELARRVLRA